MPLKNSYDVAVVGSGFAGSLLAMIARRQGRSVVLLERGRHPRFAIGESSTPLANLLLEDLAARYDLPGIAPLAKWGTWQAALPHLDCGLKRGFSFFHHRLGERGSGDRQDQLLVAASPNDRIADTHWNRADADAHFVREAQATGVDYYDEVDLTHAVETAGAVELIGNRGGRELRISAKFVADASGPRGFLHRSLALSEAPIPAFPQTQALYTHFRGVGGWPAGEPGAPYPVDDSAVHHVFDGGWIWVLKFRSGITSAGVALQSPLAEQLRLAEGAPAWFRLLELLPSVRDQFAASEPLRPFVHTPRLAFRSSAVSGNRWVLLPSAAGFVDPLLSTGFPLALLGVERLAAILEQQWDCGDFGPALEAYARRTDQELLATARLVAALYDAMDRFPVFASLSMLYFAAASYSETVRRLARGHLAPDFLLSEHPHFGARLPGIFDLARSAHTPDDAARVHSAVLEAIEPINIAGLENPDRRNWYPVDAADLFRGAAKLGASRGELEQMLARSGFAA